MVKVCDSFVAFKVLLEAHSSPTSSWNLFSVWLGLVWSCFVQRWPGTCFDLHFFPPVIPSVEMQVIHLGRLALWCMSIWLGQLWPPPAPFDCCCCCRMLLFLLLLLLPLRHLYFLFYFCLYSTGVKFIMTGMLDPIWDDFDSRPCAAFDVIRFVIIVSYNWPVSCHFSINDTIYWW